MLHAIHDFLPRHRAGSEIYAAELCKALSSQHHVTVVCAEYDPLQHHGDLRWRLYEGLPVAELVNNWVTDSFRDTYASPVITSRLRSVLNAVQPHVLHVHNLLDLSFDLPALAQEAGIPVVATLHDYTLVCASGGQRVHRADEHICTAIDTARCARCFSESPFYSKMAMGPLAKATGRPGPLRQAAALVARRFPTLTRSAASLAQKAAAPVVSTADLDARMDAAARVFRHVDRFVAPSPSLADEYRRLGVAADVIEVSDYGFVPLGSLARRPRSGPLRIGFVGTLVWHKGVHVLIDAIRRLAPDACLVSIHGDPNVFPDYSAQLRARADGYPIRFEGGFTREDLPRVYGAMDILVVPSLWPENSPLVIHEAFMAGVPVVGARSGGIVDLVRDGLNGLLYEPTSGAALAEAVQRLLDGPALLEQLVRGIPPVKSIEQDAAEWDARYRAVLAARGVTPA